jgi:HK97 family phage prohead protease
MPDEKQPREAGKMAAIFDVKADEITDEGIFTGYGSVFNVVDSYNETVDPGAFASSLAEQRAKGQMPKMLWQHQSDKPIGVWTEMREDDRGLYVRGQLALDENERNEVRQAREAYKLLKMGALDGLSIGYRVKKHLYDAEADVIHLVELELREVSPVTFPANTEARIATVKSIRDLEGLLRDAGFSRKDAKAVASHGWNALTQCDAEEDELDLTGLERRIKTLSHLFTGKE